LQFKANLPRGNGRELQDCRNKLCSKKLLLGRNTINKPLNTLDDVEIARSLIYRLLGHALAQPPDADSLDRFTRLAGDSSAIGTAVGALALAAVGTTVQAARAEYDALFIGIARGELVPYGSFYLTGFLHERPLARVREDLERLGIARVPGRSDPEDHIATLCEVMATLIERYSPEDQAAFFSRHLAPWAIRFFGDLQNAASARLFRPVGAVGQMMLEIDRQGFAYAADAPMQRGAA
jgi:TorA maturation chaperone TorD